MKDINLGIIGTGLIVKEFLTDLASLDHLHLRAIVSTKRSFETARKLAAEYGIEYALDNFEDLKGKGIDTLYIAVPNHLHFDYAKRALEAGYNVILEKPLASSDHEAKILADLARDRNLILLEAVTTTAFDSFRRIRQALDEIGDIRIVFANYSQYSRRYDAFVRGEILPVFDPAKAGGALMDLNLYNLQLVCGLFGEPESVDYRARIERGIDTNGIALLQYPGFTAICVAAKDCAGPCEFQIEGTGGCISCQSAPNTMGKITIRRRGQEDEVFEEEYSAHRVVPEFRQFIRILREHDLQTAREKLDHSLIVSRVLTAARKKAGVVFPADQY